MKQLPAILFFLLLPLEAFAQVTVGACYNITDSDARSFCIARVRRDVSQCYNIQRGDLRSMCLAEVRR